MDLVELNQYPSVAANGIATLVTDELRGKSVHVIFHQLAGTTFTRAHIDDHEIKVGGKTLVGGISGADLESMNTFNGQTTDAAYMAHYFGDPTARTIRGQHKGDLDLSVYQSPLEIKVDIGAATAPQLRTFALVGVPKMEMGIGFDEVDAATVRALIRSVVQPAAAVNRKSYGIGLGSEAGALIRQLHFFHANMTSVEFKKQSEDKHDDIAIALNSYMQKQFARVPAANHYVLDRIVDGNQGEAETTIRKDGTPWNFQVNLTTSAADTVDVYADVHTALPLI